MVNSTEAGKTNAARYPVTMGMALELETLLFPGRRLMFEAMERVLKSKDIALTPVLFSRFILRPPLEKGLEALLAAVSKKKLSVDKLVQDIQEQFHHQLNKSSTRLDPVMETLLADAAKAGARTGALSFLPADIAQELVARFGLKESLAVHVMADNPKGHPTPDGWLKLAKAMGLPSQCCLALTTSAISCKSALVAGMRCVVVPDAFTAAQDFSGADGVAEDLKTLRCKDLMALLHPCAFR